MLVVGSTVDTETVELVLLGSAVLPLPDEHDAATIVASTTPTTKRLRRLHKPWPAFTWITSRKHTGGSTATAHHG